MKPERAVQLVDLLRSILLDVVKNNHSEKIEELRGKYTEGEIINAIKAIFGR